ncbi:MAG: sulfite exporter TauE/SafE family protein [Candidatus Sulfobium sp.]|jgi:uncharacterized membrane protein YfcA
MHDIVKEAANFITLDAARIIYLFLVGFAGGVISGFVGSGGGFVLAPAMMSLGVPGLVAVASTMCHRFPKALAGAIKRARYGQVDVKLGLIFGASAGAGVLYGANVQDGIRKVFGDPGSDLYVSSAFVLVLSVVGVSLLRDAVMTHRTGNVRNEEMPARFARRVQSLKIPGTMVYFKSLNARISVLLIIPAGFATGVLAATIGVGGFIGVPSMIYVLGAPGIMASATELVVAFTAGLSGTFRYAMSGLVDIRLVVLILCGSVFGVRLGAIGMTCVKPFMVKLVMGVTMAIVLFSRGLMIPVYLSGLGVIETLSDTTLKVLRNMSFIIMVMALVTGVAVVLHATWRGRRKERLLPATDIPLRIRV